MANRQHCRHRNGEPHLILWYASDEYVGAAAGMIQYAPQGNNGFGYDPVFRLPPFGQTVAQLPIDDKNRISHRGRALASLA